MEAQVKHLKIYKELKIMLKNYKKAIKNFMIHKIRKEMLHKGLLQN